MASSAPSLWKARAQPNAIECSLAMPRTRAFCPRSGGEGIADMVGLLSGLAAPEQAPGVPRDHQLLVGGDHPGGHAAARGADARAPGVVGRPVQLQAEPGGAAAD